MCVKNITKSFLLEWTGIPCKWSIYRTYMSLPRFVKCSHWYEKWIFILNAPLSRRLEVPEGVSTEDRGHNISPSSSPSSSSAPPPLSSPSLLSLSPSSSSSCCSIQATWGPWGGVDRRLRSQCFKPQNRLGQFISVLLYICILFISAANMPQNRAGGH